MVHLACSIPNLTYPIDSHYHDQADDIITKPWVYRAGRFDLPEGPGLGVELDRDKLDFYHRHFLDNVEVNEFYDPYRPGWVPALPILLTQRCGGTSAIRLATLNLLYYPQGDRWSERRSLVETELRSLAPDVIGLQEVNRSIGQDHALAAAARPQLDYRVFRASEAIRRRYPRHWDGVVLLVRQGSAGR